MGGGGGFFVRVASPKAARATAATPMPPPMSRRKREARRAEGKATAGASLRGGRAFCGRRFFGTNPWIQVDRTAANATARRDDAHATKVQAARWSALYSRIPSDVEGSAPGGSHRSATTERG